MTIRSEKTVIGILAHVDAGKTTLAEAMLYGSGGIRSMGRVDHGDAFLDTDRMERARGITIFSKQAQLVMGKRQATLLDTPGHVDFSAEMERTLQVLDYAVLVISGADGVQGHVETLWKLLERYHVPVFLFVNKMDQPGTDRKALMEELKKRLDSRCVDFGRDVDSAAFFEDAAVCSESALEEYLNEGGLSQETLRRMIRQRELYPCFFGSALRCWGVREFMEDADRYMETREYPEEFGARVYKIARDSQGNRLTYLKVTGGILKVKMPLSGTGQDGAAWEEKADQIRLYSGTSFHTVKEAPAGTVCAVTGLKSTFCGEGLGSEAGQVLPFLEPVLNYRILPPADCDVHGLFLKLRQLEEEEPQLHIVWDDRSGEIRAQVMGEVQTEILKEVIRDRFGLTVEFDEGSIVYKETICTAAEGVGHFEPLRHYAEVHLLLEPGERGSGLVFDTVCSEDILDRNWQRLILTHLEEKHHKGVLTGSELTDVKITLLTGRAHIKHTEGGDFRQATYRAVRQGLMNAKSVLLEPVYRFRLELPTDCVGRAMADVQKMQGTFEPPVTEGETSILEGRAPVAAMGGYQREVNAYSRGRGRLFCVLDGYEPCRDAETVIQEIGYDPEADTENPSASVFCAHGAGFVVPWDQVSDYMHLESAFEQDQEPEEQEGLSPRTPRRQEAEEEFISQEEIDEIFQRTFGSTGRERPGRGNRPGRRIYEAPSQRRLSRGEAGKALPECLLVDGYNIVFAWEDLKALAETNIEGARTKLMDILCDYQGYKKCTVILVFDAYRVSPNPGSVQKYHNIHVVYTKEAETADQYIEKTVHGMSGKYRVTVATSDATEQVIILGQGAARLSAKGLLEEIRAAKTELSREYLNKGESGKQKLFENLPKEMADLMEDVRLGRKKM